MSKTVEEYLGEIRLALGTTSTDTSLFSAEKTLWALNAGLRQITTEREWPWLYATDTGNVLTTAGDDVLALPADHVRTVYLTVDNLDVEPSSARELAQYRLDDDGSPVLYAIEGSNIRLCPPPTAGLVIEHAYFCSEPTLVGVRQTITEGGSGLTSFTLSFAGQTTSSLAAAATAAQVQAALLALSTIAPGEVSVSGAVSGPYTVTFKGSLAGTSTLMTATPTGGTGTVTIALVSADQTLLIPDIYSDWVVAAAAAKLAVRTNNTQRLDALRADYAYWLNVAQDNVRRQGGTARQRLTRSSVWPEHEQFI